MGLLDRSLDESLDRLPETIGLCSTRVVFLMFTASC